MQLPYYKVLVEDSVYEIPQRLKEYDKSFFVIYNTKVNKFEVHSSDNLFSTYCFTVPYPELDQRTIDIVMKNDTKKRGAREIEMELNKHNEKVQMEKDKNSRKWSEDVARETYSAFKKDFDYEFIGMSRKR